MTLAPVIPASSAVPAPAAYASWTKKAGETISRHPIVPGRTVPEDGRPATTAAIAPSTLPTSSRDGGVGNGGSSSGGGGGGSSSIASSVGSSVSVVPDGRGKPTLRPSLVLARNPNRSGYQWPARVCDKDEVEESFSHSDLDPVIHVSILKMRSREGGSLLSALARRRKQVSIFVRCNVMRAVFWLGFCTGVRPRSWCKHETRYVALEKRTFSSPFFFNLCPQKKKKSSSDDSPFVRNISSNCCPMPQRARRRVTRRDAHFDLRGDGGLCSL